MAKYRFLISLAAAGALLPSASLAFESLPEFQGVTEEEQENFDRPNLLGGEFLNRVLSYQKPYDWEYHWLTHDVAVDGTVGSISSVHFLIESRAKIRAYLNDWLQFRFTWFEESNHERSTLKPVFELVAWPTKKLGLSLYGDVTYFKRNDDVGFALLYKPQDRHEIRLFNTYVDLTRQKRNDRTDTFLDLPYSRGLVGRIWSAEDREFFEYAVRYETKTTWRFPDQGYDYKYWKYFASVFGSRKLNERLRLNGRIQLDRRFEARSPFTASTVSSQAWRTDRITAIVETPVGEIGPDGQWTLTPGLLYGYRNWLTDDDHLQYNDYIPFARLRIPTGEGAQRSSWEFSYQLAWHRKRGGQVIALPTDLDGALNHQYNIAYTFAFKEKAELKLLAGFDGDKFGTGDSWEGGNAQLRIFLD